MTEYIQTKSRIDRIIVLLSVAWIIVSIIYVMYIMEEIGLEAYEFLFFIIIFISPVLIYWAVKWIRGGEKIEKAEKENKTYLEIILSEPSFINRTILFGLGKKLYILMLFAALIPFSFLIDVFINLHLVDKIWEYGWGNIPSSLVLDTNQWSQNSVILRAALVIGFLILVGISYADIKIQLEYSGVKGIKCSVGMMFVWFIIPFANIVMPWRVFGALDRAAKYAANYGRGGDLWNKKGHRGVSYRAILMGIMFVLTGASAMLYNKKIASLYTRTPEDIYSFVNLSQQINTLNIFIGCIYALFTSSVCLYFFFLNKNIKFLNEPANIITGKA
jgi:hypothetical protein